MSRRAKDLSLDALSEGTTQAFAVTSPRSIETLDRLGMLVDELQYRPFEDFCQDKSAKDEIAALRYEHTEARRRERIKEAKHEYQTVCATPGDPCLKRFLWFPNS